MLTVADDVTVVAGPAQAYVDFVGRDEDVSRLHADGVAADHDWGRHGALGGAGLCGGVEHLSGGGPAVSSMGALVVVEGAELREQGVELVDGGRGVARPEPFLQRLPEPFDLAAGLRVKRRRVDRSNAQGS